MKSLAAEDPAEIARLKAELGIREKIGRVAQTGGPPPPAVLRMIWVWGPHCVLKTRKETACCLGWYVWFDD